MGLVTLTHTPSPMGFLRDILDRPDHEHAMLVLPVGYPAGDAMVPDISRKSLEEVSIFLSDHRAVISFLSLETPKSLTALSYTSALI